MNQKKPLKKKLLRLPKHLEHINAYAAGIDVGSRRRSSLALSLIEREEISRGVSAGQSINSIAITIGRVLSTVTVR